MEGVHAAARNSNNQVIPGVKLRYYHCTQGSGISGTAHMTGVVVHDGPGFASGLGLGGLGVIIKVG